MHSRLAPKLMQEDQKYCVIYATHYSLLVPKLPTMQLAYQKFSWRFRCVMPVAVHVALSQPQAELRTGLQRSDITFF